MAITRKIFVRVEEHDNSNNTTTCSYVEIVNADIVNGALVFGKDDGPQIDRTDGQPRRLSIDNLDVISAEAP